MSIILNIIIYTCIIDELDYSLYRWKPVNYMYHYSNSTQTTLYFPNHKFMTQWKTCTYINDLTNNNNSGDSISSYG